MSGETNSSKKVDDQEVKPTKDKPVDTSTDRKVDPKNRDSIGTEPK